MHCLCPCADDFIGCVAVPKDCGLKDGSPCCPTRYGTARNPSTALRSVCPENHYCAYDRINGPKFPGSNLLLQPTGYCRANPPDCGKVGKPCCINQGLSNSNTVCDPENGARGYFADKDGKTWGSGVRVQDLMCNACPDKIDDALKASKPGVYKECRVGKRKLY